MSHRPRKGGRGQVRRSLENFPGSTRRGTRPALKCSHSSLPISLCTAGRQETFKECGILGWSLKKKFLIQEGHSKFISRALPACLCWVGTAQECHSFSQVPGTWWPCYKAVPPPVVSSIAKRLGCGHSTRELPGLGGTPWGEGFGATTCCQPFLSLLCCHLETQFVPGVVWSCPALPTLVLCCGLSSPCPASAHCRVFKNTEELRTRIASGIIAPLGAPSEKAKKEPEAERKDPDLLQDSDPLRLPPRQPAGPRAPTW